MPSIFKPLVITTVLATSALWAQAQAQTPPAASAMHAQTMGHHGRMDPSKMQEHRAARQAALKAKLNLNASQEGAWSDYVAAMQPSATHSMRSKNRDERRKSIAEFQLLTTPERLDRMEATKAERDTQMRKRNQATRSLYGALDAEQQKVFDSNTMMGGSRGKWGGNGRGRQG